ncbi:MAG: hypothetical protein UR95_C0010G0012 [Parcubacteria group bacterium GW2011_GWC1_36_108]|nr:MAG: hypothetical protein UR95_C0010G0012 [Parcubacteria group bacterium GW2011_GWC1_36_108]
MNTNKRDALKIKMASSLYFLMPVKVRLQAVKELEGLLETGSLPDIKYVRVYAF